MSSNGRVPATHDCDGEAAAYVLGAMEPDKLATYERHLITCSACQDEVAALTPVTEALAMGVPQYQVPRAVRRRVLAAARAESRRGPSRSRTRDWRAGAQIVARPHPAIAGTLALLLVVVAIGLAVLLRPAAGSRVLQANVVNSRGTAQLRLSGGQAELIVRHFPPPPAGSIYQVWLERRNRPLMPTDTLFTVSAAGAADTSVPENLHGFSEVLVTQEPAGGSRVPTHSPVIVARLS